PHVRSCASEPNDRAPCGGPRVITTRACSSGQRVSSASGGSMGKRIGIVIGIIVLIVLGVLGWEAVRPGPLDFASGRRVALPEYEGKPTGVPADFTETDLIARGKYLAEAADCEACHTVEGGKPFAGGRPFDTEFGTLYSPNITPDPETG